MLTRCLGAELGGVRMDERALGAQGGEPVRAGLFKEISKVRKKWTRAALGRESASARVMEQFTSLV